MTAESGNGRALHSLLSMLDLETLEVNLFRGTGPANGWQRVFGGQVLGQALVAAARTVEAARPVHSLHGYFLRGGDPHHPIVYEVERTRDGGSFTSRLVKAIQHGAAIFTMAASFHAAEADAYEHQAEMPDVPRPDELTPAAEIVSTLIDTMPAAMRAYWSTAVPIDMRPIDVTRYLSREPRPPQQAIWMRASGRLADDITLHQCVLAYASDFTLLDTALIAHGKVLFDRDIQLASLDHALWFHRPFRADEWLLYVQDSPSAAGARAFCQGRFFSADGRLVASATQEGLMRRVSPREPPKK